MTHDSGHAAGTSVDNEKEQAGGKPIMFPVPGQLVAGKERLVPRATLSRRANVALWALRVFVIVVSAMVIYTFFSNLGS